MRIHPSRLSCEKPLGGNNARSSVKTVRVCLVTEIFHPEDQGGQGQQAFALARRLQASGVTLMVLTRRNYATSHMSELLDGVHVTRLPPMGLLKGKGWAAVMPTLRFLCVLFVRLVQRRRHYDVVLVQGVKGILLPTVIAAGFLNKRCIVKIDAVAELAHDLTPESLARMRLNERSRVVRGWSKVRDALLRRADAVVAISAEIEAALAPRLGQRERIVHIPNGVELQHRETRPLDKAALRRCLGLPEGVLIVYTGRLSRAKGLMMLLEVWERLAPDHPAAHLVLVGSGDRSFDGCEMELRAYAARADLAHRVMFTGQVDRVIDYLRACDLFVLPSESEGFGLSLVEAMAAGLPCISTRVGVAPEIIRSGVNGWLVPPNDDAELRSALQTALGNSQRWPEIGAAAREVAAHFDIDRVTSSYMRLFELVTSPAPERACA